MGASGNAILALYNVPGSGKKISVHSVEIYNKNRLGRTSTVDTVSFAPQRLKIALVSTMSGGESLAVAKMNSNAPDFPATINMKTRSSYSPTLINWNGSVTYTDATVAVGDLVFDATTPGWIANEHRDAERYFVVSSGGNAGTYRIISNTTTQLTLDRPFLSNTSTTGYIAEAQCIASHGVLKMSVPSISSPPLSSAGYVNQNYYGSTGRIWARGNSSNQQDIYVRAGEKLAVFADFINHSLPVFVEATVIVEGTPNYTYQVSYYTYLDSEYETILSIDNNAGSGKVLRLITLSVSEVGTVDTPYFQLVPIGSIEPSSFVDTDKRLTVFPNNSTDGALSSSVGILFTNVPVLPYGIPTSYIAEGAPVAATPRGFNYLNSKDFIGPAYMTYFPEAAAFKEPVTTYYTAGAPGTFGTHVSHEYSRIKGFGGAPIVLREGETLGLVSGAETATGTVAIGISGFGAYEFSLTFTVEPAITPSVTLTGLQTGSDVVFLLAGTSTELANIDANSGTTYTYIFDTTTTVDIGVFKAGYVPFYIRNYALTYANVSLPVAQVADRNYSAT